jgi:hypothetical protein
MVNEFTKGYFSRYLHQYFAERNIFWLFAARKLDIAGKEYKAGQEILHDGKGSAKSKIVYTLFQCKGCNTEYKTGKFRLGTRETEIEISEEYPHAGEESTRPICLALLRPKPQHQFREIRIERILHMDRETCFGEPQLFRKKEGVLGIDFQEGYVAQRDEVDEIVEHFKKGGGPLLLVGHSAAGKTVIVRNVGYKLYKEDDWDVFLIQLRTGSDKLSDYEGLAHYDRHQTLVIIDDAHLSIRDCERFVKKFKAHTTKTKLLISTRRYEEGRRHGAGPSELEALPRKEVKASDAFRSIVKLYYQKRNEMSPVGQFHQQLRTFTHDLWALSYALTAFDRDEGVSWDRVYASVREDIEKVDIGSGESVNAANELLPLSVFYFFDIPVRQEFLIETLGLSEFRIMDLVKAGEIIEKEGTLSLHHSSLALLYFLTYIRYDFLAATVKRRIKNLTGTSSWAYSLLSLYIREFPKLSCTVINSLIRNPYLVRSLVLENIGSLKKGIRLEEDIESLCWFLYRLNDADKKIVSDVKEYAQGLSGLPRKGQYFVHDDKYLAVRCKIDAIRGRMAKDMFANLLPSDRFGVEVESAIGQVDLKKLGFFVGKSDRLRPKLPKDIAPEELMNEIEVTNDLVHIHSGIYSVGNLAQGVSKHLDLVDVRNKLEQEESISTIGSCLMLIWYIDNGELAQQLVGMLDPHNILERIETTEDTGNILYFLGMTASMNPKWGTTLFEEYNAAEILNRKLKRSASLGEILGNMRLLEWWSHGRNVGTILRSLEIPVLCGKTEEEKDIQTIGEFICTIGRVDIPYAKELVDALDVSILNDRIKSLDDSETDRIWYFVLALLLADSEKIRVLLPTVKRKVETIGYLDRLKQYLLSLLADTSKRDALSELIPFFITYGHFS